MKLIEKIKLNNKAFKVYRINQFEVYLFKKLHYKILKETPKEFDSPFKYNLIKKGISKKRNVVFLVYYKNHPVAYSFMGLANFFEKGIDYEKRYKLKNNQLPFVVDYYGSGVIKKYQGNSLQDYLLKLRERYARNLGFKYFYVSCNPKNKYSLKNIKKNGFNELYKYKNENNDLRIQYRKIIKDPIKFNLYPQENLQKFKNLKNI